MCLHVCACMMWGIYCGYVAISSCVGRQPRLAGPSSGTSRCLSRRCRGPCSCGRASCGGAGAGVLRASLVHFVTCQSTQIPLEDRTERHTARWLRLCSCARMLAAGCSAVAEKWRSGGAEERSRSGGAEVRCRGGALDVVVDAARGESTSVRTRSELTGFD